MVVYLSLKSKTGMLEWLVIPETCLNRTTLVPALCSVYTDWVINISYIGSIFNGWFKQHSGFDLDRFGCTLSAYFKPAYIKQKLINFLCFILRRQLKSQHRIRLHTCLFMSFIMTCMVTILWDLLIYNDRLDNPASTARMHRNTVTWCNKYFSLKR